MPAELPNIEPPQSRAISSRCIRARVKRQPRGYDCISFGATISRESREHCRSQASRVRCCISSADCEAELNSANTHNDSSIQLISREHFSSTARAPAHVGTLCVEGYICKLCMPTSMVTRSQKRLSVPSSRRLKYDHTASTAT